MKPILHLLGDRYKAQQYVRFAERKLAELKNLMKLLNLNMQNRLYRFTTDNIDVYIESYLGVDKIRIVAAKKKECKVRFKVELGSPLTINITIINFCDTNHFLWDYGDGNMDFASSTHSYQYVTAGTYEITLKAWNRRFPESSQIVDIASLQKSQKLAEGYDTPNDAYNAFVLAPWVTVATVTSGNILDQYFSGVNISTHKFIYIARKSNFNIDLTVTTPKPKSTKATFHLGKWPGAFAFDRDQSGARVTVDTIVRSETLASWLPFSTDLRVVDDFTDLIKFDENNNQIETDKIVFLDDMTDYAELQGTPTESPHNAIGYRIIQNTATVPTGARLKFWPYEPGSYQEVSNTITVS